jgi:O6-methylguanine-DNA--protein-cysteine methyltransferase
MAERPDRKPIANAVKGRPQDEPSFRERVYELVLRIPAGRVMSYAAFPGTA